MASIIHIFDNAHFVHRAALLDHINTQLDTLRRTHHDPKLLAEETQRCTLADSGRREPNPTTQSISP